MIVAAFLLNSDETLKKRYQYFYGRFIVESIDTESQNKLEDKKIEPTKKIDITNSNHIGIFVAAIESWKNKPILGWGHKSFRTKCYDVIHRSVRNISEPTSHAQMQ